MKVSEMKVSDLIERLQQMPADAEVVLPYVYMDQEGVKAPQVLGPDNDEYPDCVVLT